MSDDVKAKKAKKVRDEDEAEPLKKKKRVVEDDEDEAPPKKKAKKRPVEVDEPVKKAKKKVKPAAADEDDEDEAPAKKSKKKVKKAKAIVASGTNPYKKPLSAVYKIFEMAKAGTTKKAINAFIKEEGVAPLRVWRELRSQDFRGLKWKYIETDDGKITVRVKKASAE